MVEIASEKTKEWDSALEQYEARLAARRIIAVAIRVGKMIVTRPIPARHADVLKPLFDINRKMTIKPSDQGFLTNEGQFVGRIEAKRIARDAGQLLPQHSDHDELFSEDVW